MREQLILQRERLVQQIAKIDRAMKFFDQHPEMEEVLSAQQAIMGAMGPVIGGY
jgi:L-lysine 2,3-aminomutase